MVMSQMISKDSQAGIYDRLQIDHLWRYHEYIKCVEESGFFIEWDEDLTHHCEVSYCHLERSAREYGQEQLADNYAKTIAGIQQGDFSWFPVPTLPRGLMDCLTGAASLLRRRTLNATTESSYQFTCKFGGKMVESVFSHYEHAVVVSDCY